MLREGYLHDWIEGTIGIQSFTVAAGFILHFMHIITLFVFEMDRAWIENTGGRSDAEQPHPIGPDDASSNGTSNRTMQSANGTYLFCDEFSQIQMSNGLRKALAVYLLMYSALDIICTYYTLYQKTTKYGLGMENVDGFRRHR